VLRAFARSNFSVKEKDEASPARRFARGIAECRFAFIRRLTGVKAFCFYRKEFFLPLWSQ
jgi:hypothetical protein